MSGDDRHAAAPAARVARFMSYLVHWYLVVVELILGLTFLLLLLGANPDNEFARWIYRSGHRAMDPFRGLFQPINFPTSADDSVAPVLDTSLLFAMIIYGMVLLAVDACIAWLDRKIRAAKLDQTIAAQTQSYQASLAVPSSRPPDLVGQASAGRPGTDQGGVVQGGVVQGGVVQGGVVQGGVVQGGAPDRPTRPYPTSPDTPNHPTGGAR
ncbi:MAG: hypothetical protein ACK5RL_10160 [Acidimicrobiales bacterium]